MAEHHPLVELARQTIETYVREGQVIDPPDKLGPEMEQSAGAFVSLHDRHGQLRGCIGTFLPTRHNVALEVIHNAISAATRDPRFPPVAADELKGLNIKVDVLSAPEPVSGPQELDPKRYGVIVQAQQGWHRRGLLLPDLEGVDTVEEQIRICRLKAGIDPEEAIEISRFEVVRYT
jgi:AmmeMemoRadiSam system protein A